LFAYLFGEWRRGLYEKKLFAGWRDLDANAHMGNTAYLDKSVDVRMMYFADHGFPMSEFGLMKT